MSQNALLLPLPVAVFFAVALVMLGLTLGEPDFNFDQVLFPVHGSAYTGIAFLLHADGKFGQFALVEQKFTGANGVGDKVCGGGGQRLDVGAQQPGFAIFQQDIAVGQLYFAFAKAFHFPALEHDSGFEFFTDVVIEPCALIQHDGAGT